MCKRWRSSAGALAGCRAGTLPAHPEKEHDIHYGPDGEAVKRLSFHTFRLRATCLVDEKENPAVLQEIMRHSKMDMTLYYSHSRRSAKRVAQGRVLSWLYR